MMPTPATHSRCYAAANAWAAAEKRVAVSAAPDLATCGGLVKPVALHLQYVVNAKDKTLVSLL